MVRRAAVCSCVLFLIALAGTDSASAQMVGGKVVSQGGVPASGARVSLFSVSGSFAGKAEANESGIFLFPEISAGKYFIEVLGAGFETWEAGPVVLRIGDSLLVALSVAQDHVPENPVLVLASNRPWYEFLQPAGLWEYWERRERNEALGTGSFYTHADLLGWRGQPVTVTLSGLSPFLYVEPSGAGLSGLQLKGPRGCTPLVFLDGHRLRQGTEGSERRLVFGASFDEPETGEYQRKRARKGGVTPIDDFISVSQIAALEIYRGASDIPGEFRLEETGSRCGAVIVWSKRGPTG